MEAFTELLGAAGLKSPAKINRAHINRNETQTVVRRYDQSYPYLPKGALLGEAIPEEWQVHVAEASPDTFDKMLPAFA